MADSVTADGFYGNYSSLGIDDDVYYGRRCSDDFVGRAVWRIGGDDSEMEDDSAAELASSTSLQSMLSAIIEERNRDHHLSYSREISNSLATFCVFLKYTCV